ncbi:MULTISPECIES: LysE/ArgO family amino acid transporter [unclassified Vibrio]|uniref:LysE/ArgO family amino acid transporter n=1 Tax=Vibrio sp. HB236076 TaxID=3232307 RepID=A0AB39HE03_9VIBR|nr:LysE/ArgO family amino acid transporter [Vibrio sp. HB161653]MDP5253932.1 LysE/ArgO family amino acid transporter [Vibrio sp. HB161653]
MNTLLILQGFGLGASMILPIGAQNAFVLNQGIKKQHHLTTATTCSLLDMFFISVGIFGGGALIASHPILLNSLTIAGILFLLVYGGLSIRSALKSTQTMSNANTLALSRRTVIAGALAVTVFNPHLYLDTVVVLGSIGGQFEGDDRLSFALGTILASFTWFFTLSIAAAKLSHKLNRPKVRKSIDLFIAAVMFIIAFSLLQHLLERLD